MLSSGNDKKSNNQINFRLILAIMVVLGFMTLIIFTTILSVSGDSNKKAKRKLEKNMQSEPVSAQSEDSSMAYLLGVVKMVDTENKQVTIYDVLNEKEVIVNYTGSSNIRDEFGQVIAASQIDIGDMVDVALKKDGYKVKDINISTKAWKYVGVSNFTLDSSAGVMKIAKKQYKLPKELVILDGDEFISINDLAEQDVLTVWGYGETIWSISVNLGHGYVILEDYQDFLGDNITIGYEAMQQITEDMMITVREGEYNLTVENEDYSATKKVQINRNQISYVSLKDFGPYKPKYGKVRFEINPFGADLFIRNTLTSYSNEIELKYGEYPIKVSLGGYVTYNGVLNVDSPAKTIKIVLPETSSDDTVEVSEVDTEDSNKDNNPNNQTEPSDPDEVNSDTDNDGDNIVDSKHTIYIQSPTGASVYLNGEYMGTSPVSFNKIIGSHVVTFIKEGYETTSYIIDVTDDKKDAYFEFDDLIPKT